MEVLFLIGRVVLALYFLMSGFNHFKKMDMTAGYATSRGLPAAKAGVVVSGVVMVLGALGILFGLYTAWSLGALALFLLIAAFGIHHFWTDEDPQQRMNEMVNFMKNVAFAAALVMLLMVPTPWPTLI